MRIFSFVLILLTVLSLSISPVYATSRSSGSLTAANETVTLGINECGSATVQLSGTWSGTVTFEATTLGNTWVSVVAKNAATGAEATTATANGIYIIPAGGFNQIRARFSTATSGTLVINEQCGNGDNVVAISTTGATFTGGSELVDDAAFTPATSKVTVIGGEFDDTSPDSVNEGDAGAPRISANRNLYTTIRDAAGNERGVNVDSNGEIGISAIRTSITPGTSATHLGKAEDAAHTTGDTGVAVWGVRDDTLSVESGAEGDYEPLHLTAAGRVYTSATIDAALPAGTNAIGKLAANSGVDIGDVDVTSVAGTVTVSDGAGALNVIVDSGTTAVTQSTASSLNAEVQGDVADDATTPTNPVLTGGVAVETDGTDPGSVSAENDVAYLRTDRNRRLLVNTNHPNQWCANEEETGAVTNDEIKAAPGANLSLYVCSFIVSNGATAGDYSLKEDSGGTPVTIIPKIYTAVNGGAVINLNPCIRVTANQEIGVTSTTVTTGSYTVCGYTAP